VRLRSASVSAFGAVTYRSLLLPTTDNRQPTTDNRQPTTDNRQPTTGYLFSQNRIRRPAQAARGAPGARNVAC
ncbi:MAG: hypothetical protein SF339_23105, partial [Blastocatellia bacterium]|nr:hypothetical protein [Blastocatellia bacterium]